MKKKVILLVAVMTLLTLTGCGQYKGPCEACGETKPLYRLSLSMSMSVAGGIQSDSQNTEVCEKCLELLIDEAESYESQFGESVTYSYEKIEK